MGQYYKPMSLNDKKRPVSWLYSHDYDNGLKLMEHSYIGNSFVNVVEHLLIEGGAWHKTPIVWAGDYADAERGIKSNLYSFCKDENKIAGNQKALTADMAKGYKYIVNHTTKQFVNKDHVPVEDIWTDPKTNKKFKVKIHPLPLLTCEGNGRGGGDFRRENPLVGTWARNVISIENKKPTGYAELIVDFTEN